MKTTPARATSFVTDVLTDSVPWCLTTCSTMTQCYTDTAHRTGVSGLWDSCKIFLSRCHQSMGRNQLKYVLFLRTIGPWSVRKANIVKLLIPITLSGHKDEEVVVHSFYGNRRTLLRHFIHAALLLFMGMVFCVTDLHLDSICKGIYLILYFLIMTFDLVTGHDIMCCLSISKWLKYHLLFNQ